MGVKEKLSCFWRDQHNTFDGHDRIDIGLASVDQTSPSVVKPFCDVWKEMVNTANSMESHAEPGKIQVSGRAREQLVGDYSFEQCGSVELNGSGLVET